MEMKSKISRCSCNLKLKGFTTLSFRSYFYVLCLMFLPLNFLTSLIGSELSSERHNPNNVPHISRASQGGLIVPTDPNSSLKRQLWRAEVSMAKGQKDTLTKDQLKRTIEQIRSVKFRLKKKTPEPISVPEVLPIDEPNEIISGRAASKEQDQKEVESKLPYEPVTEETLQKLKELSQHPDKLDNPFEMGEILFLSGNLKEAAIFYQEALNSKSPDDASSAWDRAWILFQIGNCLQGDDPPSAMKMYGQLITEFPNSLWKDLAQARSKLLEWYQNDKPDKLIAERKL
jgi:tetratricopeptide (TPR) repeat protein